MQKDDMPVARSWHQAFRLAEQHGYEAEIKLPKRHARSLPSEFEPSPPPFSLAKGAQNVYRDMNATDSFQVRDYGDYWTIDLDRHNPQQGEPVRHAVRDAPKQTAIASVVLAGAIAVLS